MKSLGLGLTLALLGFHWLSSPYPFPFFACFAIGVGFLVWRGNLLRGASLWAAGAWLVWSFGLPMWLALGVGYLIPWRLKGGEEGNGNWRGLLVGLWLGLGYGSMGPLLPAVYPLGVVSTLLMAAWIKHIGVRQGVLSAAVVMVGVSVAVYRYPGEYYRFYQELYPHLLGYYYTPQDPDSLGPFEYYRMPQGEFYLGLSKTWLSDGGRNLEHPAMPALAAALRWLELIGHRGPFHFFGPATDDLCDRFAGSEIRFLKWGVDLVGMKCPLLEVPSGEMAHAMVFAPADAPLPPVGGGENETWSRWFCEPDPAPGQGAPDFGYTLPSGARFRWLYFRAARCTVWMGGESPDDSTWVEDPVLSRYLPEVSAS